MLGYISIQKAAAALSSDATGENAGASSSRTVLPYVDTTGKAGIASVDQDASVAIASKQAEQIKKKTKLNIEKFKKGFVPHPPKMARPKDLQAVNITRDEQAEKLANQALAHLPMRQRKEQLPAYIEKMKKQLEENKFTGAY